MQDSKHNNAPLSFITRHCIVSGSVQGVFFRQATWEKALSIGKLTGTVKNLSTSQVEVFISGPSIKVIELCTWLKKGPPLANVTNIIITDYPPTIFNNFTILR